MLLTCPHCETIFRVDTTDIKSGGRNVRCSVCTHVWQAKRGGIDALTEDLDIVDQIKSWRGAMVFVLAIILMTAGATVNRNFIAANAPWTRPLYDAMGIPAVSQLEKLEIARLSATRKRDTIRVSGEVTNLSNWDVLTPALLITVTDNFGAVLSEKSFTIDVDVIKAAMSVPFSTQVILDQQLSNDDITEIMVIPITSPR